MNNLNKKSIFAIIGLVLVLAISLVLPLGAAFADYVDDVQTITNAIVDFNQLVSLPVSRINSNVSSTYYTSINSFSYIANHKIYIKSNNSNYHKFALGNNSSIYEYVESDYIFSYSGNLNFNSILYVNDLPSGTYYLSFIDLTQMFGEGNEPNIDQARELFVADYYAYTIGTPVAYDTIDAYNNGVNAYLNSTEYVISSLGFLNSVYAVTLNSSYSALDSQVTRDSVNNRVVVEAGTSNVTPTLCLPFNYTIPTGTQITISGSCATTQYNATYYLYFGLWGNGGEMMVIPQGMVAGTQGYLRSSTITFTLPMSVDRIYIMTSDDATWYLSNFEVGYYLTNVDTLRDLGYADGVKYMQDQYAPNGALYQAIYMKGYNAYPTDDHYTFQKLIASSIDVPVQAFTNLFDYDILGVNMKTLYLSLFTLAVIVTIIRLVL